MFHVAVGADGAPFERDKTGTACLLSFLKLLERVISCEGNILVMDANCKEDDPVMTNFTEHLVIEMETIEHKKHMVENVEVKFVFQLVPCDQTWLACMVGELNNANTYFSSFANVNNMNMAEALVARMQPGSVGSFWTELRKQKLKRNTNKNFLKKS